MEAGEARTLELSALSSSAAARSAAMAALFGKRGAEGADLPQEVANAPLHAHTHNTHAQPPSRHRKCDCIIAPLKALREKSAHGQGSLAQLFTRCRRLAFHRRVHEFVNFFLKTKERSARVFSSLFTC